MLQFGKYVRPKTVAEAYEVLQKGKLNRVVGGGVWLRQQDRRIPTAIDLQDCGLDQIERIEGGWSVGAMVTLRQLECHEAFNDATCHVFEHAVRDIVGVQMRNLATVGGSLYGRFGFSDVLAALLPLDCEVELAGAGIVSLEAFCEIGYVHDVLVRLIVHGHPYRASFQCLRRSATDFPVLNVCAASWGDGSSWRIAVGARPTRATLVDATLPESFNEEDLGAVCEVAAALPMSGNQRGSERYRRHLARELTRRALTEASAMEPASSRSTSQEGGQPC